MPKSKKGPQVDLVETTEGFVSRITDSRGRRYRVPGNQVFWSVTTVEKILAKDAVFRWATALERRTVIEASADIYVETNPITDRMTRAAYIETLKKRLGQEKASDKALRKAGDIGTAVHAYIEWTIRARLGQKVHPPEPLSADAIPSYEAWELWARTNRFEPIRIENVVWSRTNQYAGTCDLLARAEFPGHGWVPCVFDWKTGKATYRESFLQNAAYAYAFVEMKQLKAIPPGVIVRLPKMKQDAPFEVTLITPTEQDEYMREFLAAKFLFERFNGLPPEMQDAA